MSRFAVMSGNTVMNIIIADTKEIAEEATKTSCIELSSEDSVGEGMTYDEVAKKFIDPMMGEPDA